MCETGFLVSGISDWEDSISSCHVLSQSVSFQVQPVQEMSGQGNYHYSILPNIQCRIRASLFTGNNSDEVLMSSIQRSEDIPYKILFI